MRRPPFAVQRAVLHALVMRELRTRFGRYRLGYFSAVPEPIAHVLLLSFVFSLRGRGDMAGIELPVLIITGIVPFILFRTMITRCMSAAEANSGLFGYRQVKPLDAALARLVLECLIHACVLALLLGGRRGAGALTHRRARVAPRAAAGSVLALAEDARAGPGAPEPDTARGHTHRWTTTPDASSTSSPSRSA